MNGEFDIHEFQPLELMRLMWKLNRFQLEGLLDLGPTRAGAERLCGVQLELKERATGWMILRPHPAATGFDDRAGNCQSHAETFLLRGEEWAKDVRHHVARNARSGVAYGHTNGFVCDAGMNLDPAPAGRLIAQGALRQDPQPCFYFYRQIMGTHGQTGLVAAASCKEYLKGIIRKHELTRPDKEDDRVRHIETLDSQTGPVFLTYAANRAMDEFVVPEVDAVMLDVEESGICAC